MLYIAFYGLVCPFRVAAFGAKISIFGEVYCNRFQSERLLVCRKRLHFVGMSYNVNQPYLSTDQVIVIYRLGADGEASAIEISTGIARKKQ